MSESIQLHKFKCALNRFLILANGLFSPTKRPLLGAGNSKRKLCALYPRISWDWEEEWMQLLLAFFARWDLNWAPKTNMKWFQILLFGWSHSNWLLQNTARLSFFELVISSFSGRVPLCQRKLMQNTARWRLIWNSNFVILHPNSAVFLEVSIWILIPIWHDLSHLEWEKIQIWFVCLEPFLNKNHL